MVFQQIKREMEASAPRAGNTKGGSITALFDMFGSACFANKNKNFQLPYS